MSLESTGLPVFNLGVPGEHRDFLVGQVCSGAKTATSSLLRHWLADGERPPDRGDRFELVDSSGACRGVIEIVDVRRVPLGQVDEAIAHAEGEGFRDAADWRDAHERFWCTEDEELVRPMSDDEPVVVEFFTRIR